MRRNFTEGEWSHILAPPTHQQQLAVFYRFWVSRLMFHLVTWRLCQCLKESFIKAEGSGLSYGLQRLQFSPDSTWPPPQGVRERHTERLSSLSLSPPADLLHWVGAGDRQIESQ